MRYSSKLIAKPIIDKNGKHTTVHVLPNSSTKSRTVRVEVRRSEKTHGVIIPPSPQPLADRDPNSIFVIKRWSGVPLKHSYVYSPTGGRFVLAPEGYSGAYCDECGSFFRDDEVNDASVVCQVCFRHSRGGRIVTGVRYNEVALFDDDATRDSDWYHVTTRSDWDGEIREKSSSHQPLVHVGSLEAATRRMNDIIAQARSENRLSDGSEKSSEVTFYLYRVRLAENAPLSPHVLLDFDATAPSSVYDARKRVKEAPEDYEEFYGSYELYGATRYVNEYESHGSISLIAHPEAIEVVEREELQTVSYRS